jgi:hypothetical protein
MRVGWDEARIPAFCRCCAGIPYVISAYTLDQREAAEIFGHGVNAFSRYESGKTKPPLALVKLFAE